MKLELFVPIAFKYNEISDNEVVMAGDVGGTKANLMLCRFGKNGLEIIFEKRYVSTDHISCNGILEDFLKGQPAPKQICLSVAGPVIEGKVKFTNLSWLVDPLEISKQWNHAPVALLNDLEATAYGLAALKQDELHMLQKGSRVTPGNIAILAPGTGLGEAGLFFDGRAYHPFATEGGHCDFAPRTAQDTALLKMLQGRHEHVSWERLLSGVGIYTIWQFLTSVEKKSQPDWLLKEMEDNDPSAMISKAAAEKKCATCTETMELFNRYLAIEATNLILKLKATGGLFISGGIPPKILPLMNPDVWAETFENSGRMRALLAQVNVQVILNQKAPLLGTAYYAGLNMD